MFRFDWMVSRMLAGVIASSVVAVIVIGVLLSSPQPVPPIRAQVKPRPAVQDGVLQTHYFAGLLKEEWTYQNGVPHGLTRQYYPNGSLFRELHYVDGAVDGRYLEYHEKTGRERRGMRLMGHGEVKAKGFFTGGKRDGPMFIYHPNGIMKEEREYRNGQKVGTWIRYHEDGRVRSKKNYGTSGLVGTFQ